LQLTASQCERQPVRLIHVLNVQVEVDLLLLRTGRPVWAHVVRGRLHTHHSLAVHDDAVPVLIGPNLAAKQDCPERALSTDVSCVEDDDASADSQGSSRDVRLLRA
jgi:hypothetical protein